MKWHYVENGTQAGPVEEADLGPLLQSGKLTGSTLVWHEGMANWEPFSAVCPAAYAALVGVSPVAGGRVASSGADAACAECGGVFNKNDMLPHGSTFICARCKPIFMQKLAEGATINTGGLNYAGFGIRFGAKFLDGLILGVIFGLPMMIFLFSRAATPRSGEFDIFPLLIQLGYQLANMAYAIFFLGKYGATPGKMICKIKVVNADGSRLTYGRATGRFFSEILSGMICYIGYLMAAFDKEEHRSLHDRICNTRVIYK